MPCGFCFSVHLNEPKDVLENIASLQCKDCLDFQNSKCRKGFHTNSFTFATNIALLLQKQVERVDLFIQSDNPVGNRIKIPADIVEYNKRKGVN